MKEPLQILDCGCGIGRWTKQLIKHFPKEEIIALDNKKRLPNLKGVKFFKGSIENLPFKNNVFDLIIVSRVLPYVNLIKSIKELERVCKPQGVIVYELMQIGYYLKRLLEGQLKKIVNFLNAALYQKLERKIFKKYDNIDSWIMIRYYSEFEIAERYPLKHWRKFPVYSLLSMNSEGKIYKKQLHNKIKKIAKEILNEET